MKLGFAVVILIGLFGGFLIFQNLSSSKQESMQMDHSDHAATVTDDKSFILGMVPHHEEAITSSEEVLTVAQTPEVRALAENIIQAQKKEVAEMKNWYEHWFDEPYKDDGKYQPMMPSLEGKSPEDAEQFYLSGMIGHHEAAVVMAKEILKKTERNELKTMGNTIIKTQNEEINTMKGLLKSDQHMDHSSH